MHHGYFFGHRNFICISNIAILGKDATGTVIRITSLDTFIRVIIPALCNIPYALQFHCVARGCLHAYSSSFPSSENPYQKGMSGVGMAASIERVFRPHFFRVDPVSVHSRIGAKQTVESLKPARTMSTRRLDTDGCPFAVLYFAKLRLSGSHGNAALAPLIPHKYRAHSASNQGTVTVAEGRSRAHTPR